MVDTLFTNIATLGGITSLVPLSGGIAVVLGVLWFVVASYYVQAANRFWLLHVSILVVAVIASHFAELSLGQKDSSSIIIDEFVAVPLIFIFYELTKIRNNLPVILLGIVLFGIFDVFKPFPIDLVEQIPGGIGIVLDDAAAAVSAGVVLCILQRLRTIKRTKSQ